MAERMSWDEYFMQLTELVSKRSTCLRRNVGAVLVKSKTIISTGYNGAPRGTKHCFEAGCIRKEMNVPSGERHEICRAVHAEQNVIIISAQYGSTTQKTTMYVTNFPCVICAKMIVQSGIERLVYTSKYGDELSEIESAKILRQAGIQIQKI